MDPNTELNALIAEFAQVIPHLSNAALIEAFRTAVELNAGGERQFGRIIELYKNELSKRLGY